MTNIPTHNIKTNIIQDNIALQITLFKFSFDFLLATFSPITHYHWDLSLFKISSLSLINPLIDLIYFFIKSTMENTSVATTQSPIKVKTNAGKILPLSNIKLATTYFAEHINTNSATTAVAIIPTPPITLKGTIYNHWYIIISFFAFSLLSILLL